MVTVIMMMIVVYCGSTDSLVHRSVLVYQLTRCHCDQLPTMATQGLQVLFKKTYSSPTIYPQVAINLFLKMLSDETVTISSGK